MAGEQSDERAAPSVLAGQSPASMRVRAAATVKTIILSGAISLVTALLGTPLIIRLMRRLGYGQPIRLEGLKSHETKRGTPTMGGAVFIAAALIGYVAGQGALSPHLSVARNLALGLRGAERCSRW